MMQTKQIASSIRVKMLAGLAVGVIFSLTSALAGPAAASSEDAKDLKGLIPPPCGEKDWTLELGSGGLWSNVRTDHDKAYTIIPVSLTASLRLDDVGL
jgi:hypothetical protein